MHPTFGRYELLKRLAGGGMGEVYLARQRGLDGFQKLLVIKTLLPHLCEDEEFITMFKDEARLTAQLVHPNICQVFEFDQVEGTYYIAMEYLRGEDLRRLWKACELKQKPLRVPLICRVISDAAAGLDFAHSLRNQQNEPYHIVHRDISPQNILVTFEGGVKVIDFGVAKAAGRAQHTRTGALKGKYSYMSPEQVSGKNIDGRADIFSLGIVLHELLTGRRLFKADSDVQTLDRVRECAVPPPSQLNPQLPQSLDGIVMHALAKDPRERFQTAQELRLALEDWLTQGRMSASSAHLAEFLKIIYAERLEKEARLGPLLGDPGLSSAPDNLKTPSMPSGSASPSIKLGGPAPMGTSPGSGLGAAGTVNQRAGEGESKSQLDFSQINTENSADGPFKKKSGLQLRISIGVAVLAVIAAAVVLLKKPSTPTLPVETAPAMAQLTVKSEPPGANILLDGRTAGRTPAEALSVRAQPTRLDLSLEGYVPRSAMLNLVAGPQTKEFTLERAAPQRITLKLSTDPPGAEITEGPVVIGKTPSLWTTEKGPHTLTFTLPGYRELTQPILAQGDNQDLTFKLKKLEGAKKDPGLDIKIER